MFMNDTGIKNSVVYTYAFSQAYTNYVSAQPIQHEHVLIDSKPLYYGENGDIDRLIQLKSIILTIMMI